MVERSQSVPYKKSRTCENPKMLCRELASTVPQFGEAKLYYRIGVKFSLQKYQNFFKKHLDKRPKTVYNM
jgi:hypothetical protein